MHLGVQSGFSVVGRIHCPRLSFLRVSLVSFYDYQRYEITVPRMSVEIQPNSFVGRIVASKTVADDSDTLIPFPSLTTLDQRRITRNLRYVVLQCPALLYIYLNEL